MTTGQFILRGTTRWLVLLLGMIPATQATAEDPILMLDPGGHMATINDIQFTADGRQLVTAGDDKVVRVWDLASGRAIRTLRGEIGPGRVGQIYAMALSPDDRWLAVSGWMAPYRAEQPNPEQVGAIRLYDFASGHLAAVLEGHTDITVALAFSPDGSRIVSGSLDRSAIVWDLARRRRLHTLRGHQDAIYAVAFSRDGQSLATGSDDGDLRLWNANDGQQRARLAGHRRAIESLAASAQGQWASGSSDGTIRIWETDSVQPVRTIALPDQRPGSLSFSPNGEYLVTGVSGGKRMHCLVYQVADGRLVSRYAGHDNAVLATAVSPDGQLAATAGGSQHQIHLWSLPDARPQRILRGRGSSVWAVGFSADGHWLAWGMQQGRDGGTAPFAYELRLPGAGELLGVPQRIATGRRYESALTRVGQWSLKPRADASGVRTRLEIHQGQRVAATIERGPDTGFQHRAFTLTPDAGTVLSAGANGILDAYDRTGAHLGTFEGHTGDVWALAVSPDGQLLASASADQTVRVWDIASRGLLLTLFQDAGPDEIEPNAAIGAPAADDALGEWIAWTSSGYYTTSARGDRYIGWHQNRGLEQAADYFPATQFAAKRYRPQLVSDTIERRSETMAVTALGQREPSGAATLIAGVPDRPRVLTTVPAVVDNPALELQLEVDARTERLTLNVNGLGGARGFQRTDLAAHATTAMTRTVALRPGENRIEIVARNASGDSPSVILGVVYRTPDFRKPNLYILAIGVSNYADAGLNLAFAAADAQAIARRFERERDAAERIYKEVLVQVLTDRAATRQAVIDAMEFLQRMTEDDLAILFVAGHGMQDERGNFYYLPHDVDTNRLRSTAVAWKDFREVIDYLPGKVMLLADTCHSGSIYGTRGRRAALDMTQLAREFADAGRGAIVFASSQGREFSEERTDWGHGAFTRSLLDGLAGAADYTKDQVIRQAELETYVKERVVMLTEGRQHPVTIRPDVIADFAIAVYAP